jgi:hypothetical protein
MGHETKPIFRTRGDTYRLRVTLSSGGTALNLTDCTILLTVSSEAEPTDSTNQLFQIAGSIYGAATNGIVDFEMNESDADNLGRFFYDIEVTDSAGQTRTVLSGEFIFEQDITKSPIAVPETEWTWTWDNGSGQGEPVDPQTTPDWQYYDRFFYGAIPAYGTATVEFFTYPTLILASQVQTFPSTLVKRSSIWLTGDESPVEPDTSYELYAQVYANPTDFGGPRRLKMGFTTGAGAEMGYGLWVMFGTYMSNVPQARRSDGDERLEYWNQNLNASYQPTVECSMGLRVRLERDTGYARFKLWQIWETGGGLGLEPPGWDYERQDPDMGDHPRLYPYFLAESWGAQANIHLINVRLTEL